MNHSNGTEFWISPSDEPCPAASLPPRKRLLAGLKLNGWLSSIPAAPPTSMQEAEQAVPPPSAQFAQPDRECLGESGQETIVLVERIADEDVNADKSESGSKRQKSSSPAANSRGSVTKLSQTTSKFSNHGESKLRRRSKGSEAQPSSSLQSTTANLRKESVSHLEVAAAAKLTAVMAAKTAAEAKAIATDKAAAAAKAAAVAKDALEAVAIATCNEAQRRWRKSSRRHHKNGISGQKLNTREAELQQEMKLTRVSPVPRPVDDEELARQLHRAMNSSPRISRSRTPCHRSKEDGTSLSSSHIKFQCNYKHGRRRSSSLKDVGKPKIKTFRQSFDSKSHCGEAGVQSESMVTTNEMIPVNNLSQWPGSSENKISDDITPDSAASQGHAENMARRRKPDGEHMTRNKETKLRKKRINEDPGLLNCLKDHRISKSTSTSKNESVYSNDHMLSNVNSENWAGKGNGVHVEQSVNQSAPRVREKKVAVSRNSNKKRSGGRFLLDCSTEMHDLHSERHSEEAKKQSTICTETLLSVTLTVTEDQEVKGAPNRVVEYDELLETDKPDLSVEDLGVDNVDFRAEGGAIGLSLGSEIKEEKFAQKEERASSVTHDLKKRTCSDGRSTPMLTNLSLVGEQTWHQ